MNSRRWITLALVFCLVLGNIAPAAGAVTFGPADSSAGGSVVDRLPDGIVDALEKTLGITLREDQSHLQDLDDNVLSLVDGKWVATLTDGKTVELTTAQLPQHIQELQQAAGDYQPMDIVTAFVVLRDAPAADTYTDISDVPAELTAQLEAKQDALLETIREQVGPVQLVDSFTYLTNSVVISTAFENLEKIAAISGVTNVFLNPVYEAMEAEQVVTPYTMSSNNMTGVSSVWQDLGYTGQGMTIAILDTGLDLDHPSFAATPEGALWTPEYVQQMLDTYDLNVEGLYDGITAEDLYYNGKIPYAFNYAMGTTNVSHSDGVGDHGTHVAGIAAANVIDGKNAAGMAPDAQLIAMKVFSATGGANMYTIVAALEDCMIMGVDVANLSLGSACGFSISGQEEVDSIFRRLAECDLIVDVAVGNEGNSGTMTTWGYYMLPTTHIDNGSVASPSTYANSMGVGSVDNAMIAADYFALADGTEIFYRYSVEFLLAEVDVTLYHLKDLGNLEYVIIDGLGNEEDFYDENGVSLVEGKVAVVPRGVITFGEKSINAQNAGAVGVVIWNNDDSYIYDFNMTTSYEDADGNEAYPEIPVGMISMEDGQKMADAEEKYLYVTGDYSFREDKYGGQMSSFSCWGTSPDLRLLPDITGVGGNVFSTLDGGYYGLMSGTSMACPQVAGVTALVLQYLKETFPDATEAEMRTLADALLMSTAETVISNKTGLEASPRQQGAGLVNALNAITAEAYLQVVGSTRPKAELGDNEDGEFSFTFTVHNFSDAAKTYTLRSSLLCEDYELHDEYPDVYFLAEQEHELDNSAVTFSRNTVTVAPGESQEITVTIKLTEADKEWIHTYFPSGNYVEGYVYLESEDEVTLSLPFMGFYERWDEAPLFDTGFWYEEGLWEIEGAEQTANQYYHMLWTSLGSSDWMLGKNPYMENIEYDDDGNAISMLPYNTYNNVLSPNGDGVLDQITEIYLSLMRNSGEIDLVYTDAEGNELHRELLVRDTKAMYISGYDSVVPLVYSWYYDDLYDFSDLEDGDVVYLSISGRIDYPGAETDVLFDKFPIYIDTSAPSLDMDSVVESHEDGRSYLTMTFTDAHPAAAIVMNKSGTQLYSYWGDDVMVNNGDGTYTVTVDITNLGQEITVALCDYGGNEAFYDLTYTKTENLPQVDKSLLYAYQIYDEAYYSYYGWDYMFGWTNIDRETGEVVMINSDAYEYYSLVAAEYVDGLVFAVDAGYNFLYMVPGLWNRMEICNLGVNVLDMAWDDVTHTMYVTTKTPTGMDFPSHTYGLYTLDIMTGELTLIKEYSTSYYAPYTMTFVEGKLYAAISERSGLFEIDTATGVATSVKVNDEVVRPTDSRGNILSPSYSQSMTYSKADGKIYWAYYGKTSELIVIDPTDWSWKAISFGIDREYVGLLTMEDDDYTIPESDAVTRLAINDTEVLLKLGSQYSLNVKLLPWNAPVTDVVVWSSSDESVATVDQNGNVVTVGEGTAIITAAYGDLEVTCEVISVDVKSQFYTYNFYSGLGYGDWLQIDMAEMSWESLGYSPADFIAAEYNGHDGCIYGYNEVGQCYRLNTVTGECDALGTSTGTLLLDMAYDYSTGLMYGVAYDSSMGTAVVYYVNMQTGALVEAGEAYDALMTLACDMEGNLYAINAVGILVKLIKTEGDLGGGIAPWAAEEEEGETSYYYELEEIMRTPVSTLQYTQSMCYDHNNDVLLWTNPETGMIYQIKPGEYVLAAGEPTGTGFVEFTGMFVIPDEIPELAYTPVEKVTATDMLVLTDCAKVPAVNCFPLNATNQADVTYVSADESIAKVENGMIVGVSVGSTTVTATLIDTDPNGVETVHTCTFTVTVKLSTDNIFGYLMLDTTAYNGYAWIEMDDANPNVYEMLEMVYDGGKGIYYTLYSAEYVNGVVYAYGFNDEDWNANFQFLTIDPKTWSITSVKDMGDEFPFVYDMAFDYTSGTMYALAGSSSATALYIVNMASGSLIECMDLDKFLMSLTVDEKGTMYGIAFSEETFDPLTSTSTYDTAKMYVVDVKNGTCELFMDTGVMSNQISSMAYDFDTGYIYWTGFYAGTNYVSGLHLIDPADRTCYNLGAIGGQSQVTGLMILADAYPKTPNTLQNVVMISSVMEMNVGDRVAAELFMSPATPYVQTTWTSSDPSIAAVTANGEVIGVSAGTATITATIRNAGKTFTARARVLVYLPEDDNFLVYNRDDMGFSTVDRIDSTKVTNQTEGEDAEAVRAMEMVDGVIYAYDEAGNYFITTAESGYERTYLGTHGLVPEEPYEWTENYGTYSAYYRHTPQYVIRDMAWDPVNQRMLALGCYYVVQEYYTVNSSTGAVSSTLREELEYEGGCRIYEVDLETGALTELTAIYTNSGEFYSGVSAMTVTDKGQVYLYSGFMDYICTLDMSTGLTRNIATFQNLGYYGETGAPMSMAYDSTTNHIYILFTTNNNAYFLFKYSVANTRITSVGNLGEEYDSCAGLIINHHTHSYKETILDRGDCQTHGTAKYTCSCGKSYTAEIGLGDHYYVHGACVHCGEEGVTPGDVIGDGDGLNIMDVSALLSVAMGYEVPEGFDETNGDIDGDGVITTTDVFMALDVVLSQG